MKPEKILTNLGLSVNFVIIILLLVVIYYLYLMNDNLSNQGFGVGAQRYSTEDCQQCFSDPNCRQNDGARFFWCTER